MSTYTPSPNLDVPWKELQQVNDLLGVGWKERRFITRTFASAYNTLKVKETGKSAGWAEKTPLDEKVTTKWDALEKREIASQYSWRNRFGNDRVKNSSWQELEERDLQKVLKHLSPGQKDKRFVVTYEKGTANDINRRIPWVGRLPIKDLLHRTVWGPKYYAEICYRKYRPENGERVNLNLNLPITNVGDKLAIDFFFDQLTYDRRCSQQEPSGWRDAYFYVKPDTTPKGFYSRIYIMQNTALLTRLPDRAPIDATSITLSTDWDSSYWTIKAAIGSDNHLAMLEPTEDGPMLVEAVLNGYLWNMQIDKCGGSKAFGSRSRHADGRSVSAQFGAPTANLRTWSEAGARTAQQLLEYELNNTGWTVVMAEDWLVPGGTFEYQNQTPMQIIKTVADACGAMVQSHMSSKTIIVSPKYKAKPWLLSSTFPDVIIPSSMVEKIDYEWDERPLFNAAFVSGEINGISTKVTRGGTAGDLIAPMTTDKLITATEPATARGLSIIAASGRWSKHRIELPVFPSPGVPGVLLPGTIIQFADGIIVWKGYVTAVSVTANRPANGLKIRQTIDIERYRGN